MKEKFIIKIREFNRFYTDFLGSLNKKVLSSKFSLPEARVLFEIRNITDCTAKDIVNALNIDKSYLSRILKSFHKKKLIIKERSSEDARNYYLVLSEHGKKELLKLESDVNRRISSLYEGLTESERNILEQSMQQIRKVLSGK